MATPAQWVAGARPKTLPAAVAPVLVGSGAAAALAGLALAALSSWWLVAVGAVCIVAAWTYTGGPLPYGYRALGEVFVFVFFGLVAVVVRPTPRPWSSR